ncbi:alpha-E domain-containing protein, partial [Acidihalobacter prosperus]
ADESNPGSLLSSLQYARENARTIRDTLPSEGWERINNIYLKAKSDLPSGLARSRRHDNLVETIASCQQITGMLSGTMLHNEGYNFLRIGRNLERADMTTRIIDVRTAHGSPDESTVEHGAFIHAQWLSLLQSISAYQAYWLKVQAPVRRQEVLEFLFKERQFPRSVLHCICEVAAAIENLPRNKDPLSAAGTLAANLEKRRVGRMDDNAIHGFVDNFQLRLGKLHKIISKTYFQFTTQKLRKPRARNPQMKSTLVDA